MFASIKRTKASASGLPDPVIMHYGGGQIRVRAGTRWHVLQPRLGAFLGEETRIPYDYHEVLALIAPRPLLLVAPKYDREHNLSDIRACVGEVARYMRYMNCLMPAKTSISTSPMITIVIRLSCNRRFTPD